MAKITDIPDIVTYPEGAYEYQVQLPVGVAGFDRNMVGGVFVVSGSDILLARSESFSIDPNKGNPNYVTTIKRVIDERTIVVDTPYVVEDISAGASSSIYREAGFSTTNAHVTFSAAATYTASENIRSFARLQLTDLTTFSGDVYSLKVYCRSAGADSDGGYEEIGDVTVDVVEMLVDSASRSPSITDDHTGYFFNQNQIDTWWTASVHGDIGQGGTYARESLAITAISDGDTFYVTASQRVQGAPSYSLQHISFIATSSNALPAASSHFPRKDDPANAVYYFATGSTVLQSAKNLSIEINRSLIGTEQDFPVNQRISSSVISAVAPLLVVSASFPGTEGNNWGVQSSSTVATSLVGGAYDAFLPTYSSSRLLDAMVIPQPQNVINGAGDYFKVMYTGSMSFFKDGNYSLFFNLFGDKKTSDEGVLEIYMTGSAFDPTQDRDTTSGSVHPDGYWYVDKIPLGKKIGTVRIPDAVDNHRWEDRLQADFIADASGSGSVFFRVLSGEWHLSDISIRPARDLGFSPCYSVVNVPIPSWHRQDYLDFKVDYYDRNGNRAPTVSTAKHVYFNGGNVYIGGTDNLLSGSLYIGDALYGGIEIAGKPSAFIRSVGYEGFHYVTGSVGQAGFALWSGSVTFGADEYLGVGAEFVGSADSYFRFRTNPSELDVRASRFYIGSAAAQFISGAANHIEISSSKFHLDTKNDLLIIGAGTVISASLSANEIYTPATIAGSPSNITNASSSITSDGYAKFVSASIGGWNITTSSIENETSNKRIRLDGVVPNITVRDVGTGLSNKDGVRIGLGAFRELSGSTTINLYNSGFDVSQSIVSKHPTSSWEFTATGELIPEYVHNGVGGVTSKASGVAAYTGDFSIRVFGQGTGSL